MRYLLIFLIIMQSFAEDFNRCSNSKGRFDMGKTSKKSCEWVATTNTQERCENEQAILHCPAICDASCPCTNTEGKFKVRHLQAELSCIHGRKSNGKPKRKFCRIKEFSEHCPMSCQTECKSGNGTCEDKNTVIRTIVPSFRVSCTKEVTSWYPGDDYCSNSTFRSKCPEKCKLCPSDASVM